MKRLTMLLAASLAVTSAGAAAAKDTRSEPSPSAAPCTRMPTTTDEARALGAGIAAGTAAASAPAKPAVHVDRMPSSTDEVRAIAAEPTRVAVVAASSASRGDRIASSTDEARAIAAVRTSDTVATGALGHEEVCARCACNLGEQHARAAVDPCGCHHRT